MTDEVVERSLELQKLIATTKQGLTNLKELCSLTNQEIRKRGKDKKFYIDDSGSYNLCVAKYRDGSGKAADLARYRGNEELLNIIISTLEKQLAEFEKLYAEL